MHVKSTEWKKGQKDEVSQRRRIETTREMVRGPVGTRPKANQA